MSDETEAAGRYRQHAAQLLSIAEADRDPNTSKTLRQVAQDYELMAQVFDDIDHVTKLSRSGALGR
jgi:adenine C2-methylase RlmN of 23S rRNA A2503 and tRNA A37